MPRPEISALHQRLRRRVLGLDKHNDELERTLRPKIRLVGSWWPSEKHVAWFARTLAEVYTAGSGDPVRGVFNGRQVGSSAWYYLERLVHPAAHEAVRQVWLEYPDSKLRDLVKDWLPTDPREQAVTLFLLGDFDRYTPVDPSGELIESARAEGDPGLRVQLALAARRWNRLGWAYRVAAVPEHLLPEEWEAVIELLRNGERQQYLWQLIDRAPLKWSARCLNELGGWQPVDEPAGERLIQLAGQYAERCSTAQPFELLARLDGQEKN